MAGIQVPAPKAFRRGTHRLVAPEETVAWVWPFLPAMGITRIANVTGLDCIGIPVVMVCRPNSRAVSVSQGKGVDLAAAQASGLMECVEGYHGERIDQPLQRGSFHALRDTHRLVEIDGLPQAPRGAFSPDRSLLWIEGEDLIQRERVWVPYEMVSVDFTLPRPAGSGCFYASSNGLASGNHLLEAISHGICEVVERDATALFHLLDPEERETARIDLATIEDPGCREVLEKCEGAGIAVAVWETTSDVGIPAFMGLLVERDTDPLRPHFSGFGMGCHPVREIALLRALTEAAQSRLTVISGSRDDLFRGDYERFWDGESRQRKRRLIDARGPMRSFQDVPTQVAATFDEDVAWELERLQAVGISRVVVVDLTRPEFGIPVARVIIPGLEPAGPELYGLERYAPGPRAQALFSDRPPVQVQAFDPAGQPVPALRIRLR
jgi:ribosomal protein S12 methylthiotransferase accessory factor